MSKLGWGKKKITEGCINDWYKDRPIGIMVKDMRDNHRLLAQEQGGGKYKDSILVYDKVKFMKALNLPEPSSPCYIELAEAVKIYQGVADGDEADRSRVQEIIDPTPIETKIDMVHNLQFFTNGNGSCLWKTARWEKNGTEQEKADMAESIKTLESLKIDGLISLRRTSADNLSIKLLKDSNAYIAEQRQLLEESNNDV